MSEVTVVKTIAVSGFDPEGEPEIREMSDTSGKVKAFLEKYRKNH